MPAGIAKSLRLNTDRETLSSGESVKQLPQLTGAA